MAKQQIRDYVFTPGSAGAGTIKIPGKWDLNQLLVITNTTVNTFIYNFADIAYAGTTVTFTRADDSTNFPKITSTEDGYTTITLAISTSTMSSTDTLQIFVEHKEQTFRPYRFGTDAIERMRVSNPQSMIDADFEYGLQPTKWAGYGTVRGYPSAYELPGVDLTVTAVTTDYQTTSTTNSVITITFATVHGMLVGDVVNVAQLSRAITGFSRADGNFVIASVPTTSSLTYFARGVVGTGAGQSLYVDETVVKRGALYSGASIPVASLASNGATPSVITVNFTNPHGLIPGTTIYINVASGTNAALATGPFVISSVPSLTSFTYTARGGGAVATPATATLYAFSNSTITHRSQDGGVILETKTPTYGAAVIRQSKKYFRYQSGKGFLWSSGTLLKPNYDLQSVTASGTTIGSTITVSTDDIDHGLQVGATIRLDGITTTGYNGTYIVASIVTDYQFTITATQVLGAATADLGINPKVFVTKWQGSSVRAGMFDDQNGIFWEHDGNNVYLVKRSSTTQITGRLSVTTQTNLVTGTDTRFTQQLKVGDRIVIRGMTHFVTRVIDATNINVSPDYRGITVAGVKGSLISEQRIKQSDFNIDTIDGNGPSGFIADFNKMHMIGLQFSWYGAGFIDYMIRGNDGNWIICHRMKNNNVNNEAYMRSGNLPVRYSIENDCPAAKLSASMNDSQTTIPLEDLTFFPDAGTVYIDNEMISYTGRSVTSGAGNLTGCTRAASLTQYQAGSTNTFTAAAAATHSLGTGVIVISNTCSPTLSHWGSALIMDGGYDEDRGYIFNYQRTGIALTTGTQTAFLVRLAPSVDNSQTGALGVKNLLNRSQLLLQAVAATISAGGAGVGAVIVEGVLNPKNFASATWANLGLESNGGQPSFSQVATSVTWSSGTFALPGEQVFAFTGSSSTAGADTTSLDLSSLKELTGAPLGGDFKYPDGSDILAINVRLTASTGTGAVLLRWSEAQA